VKRREKRELKCGGETEAKRARQKRTKVKKGCSGWLEPREGGWGRGCRVKGWFGVRGQAEKTDTETEEFKQDKSKEPLSHPKVHSLCMGDHQGSNELRSGES